MLALKLAYRNLKGAGLRTWLNVAVLSLAYVLIIWHQGIFTGMLKHGSRAVIEDEIAGGQYWHKNYDPFDPLSYDESHGPIPAELSSLIEDKKATPILIRQAAIYPEGRVQTVLLKGIEPGQKILGIPSASLGKEEDALPVLIGRRMARSTSLDIGDYLTIRWRDVQGTFDAVEGKIVEIMNTEVVVIDKGQLWVPLAELQKMTGMKDEATIIVVSQNVQGQKDVSDWKFKDQKFLLTDINQMVRSKRISASILYVVLLFLAMLAIFDTQVLSIFKRRKEIGTLIALGMTRRQVISLFTLEGAMHGILAIGIGAIYGIPWITFYSKIGMKVPQATEEYGFALAERLFPSYSVALVLGTVLIVMATVTIVSYLPTRKISKMKPTEALKGKIS
ncbi:FtsX-like permease family protein [bacterium]|nr:FtsX-like permease family protein [bacterium]NIN92705.1 FtsX-like permease family protein [bacterium]NIO18686.1 FtsX-like permease family protein [bacterium]NIO73762.1 FtsX-like permease family protein [bacterium]